MTELNLRGVTLRVHDDEMLSNAIKRDGDFWEADILDYLQSHITSCFVIIDIGANVGNHTTFFAKFLNPSYVWAFEPIKENYELLKQNIWPFKDTNASYFAISDHSGTVKITPNWTNMGAAEISDDGEREVPCWTLDDFYRQIDYYNKRKISLIKIDAERHEPSVLRGARKVIEAHRPLILVEDANNEYGPLLEAYTLSKSWEHHKTYLYRHVDEEWQNWNA